MFCYKELKVSQNWPKLVCWVERGCKNEINGPIQPITAMTVAVMVWKWAPVMWIPSIPPGQEPN